MNKCVITIYLQRSILCSWAIGYTLSTIIITCYVSHIMWNHPAFDDPFNLLHWPPQIPHCDVKSEMWSTLIKYLINFDQIGAIQYQNKWMIAAHLWGIHPSVCLSVFTRLFQVKVSSTGSSKVKVSPEMLQVTICPFISLIKGFNSGFKAVEVLIELLV